MNKKNEIAVGLFFFIAMTILGYFTIVMSGDIFRPHDYYSMSVLFNNVEGLGKSDKVKINGVLSGIVEDIQLREVGVWVLLKMHREVTLYENFKIKIKNETALAGKYIGIDPGSNYHEGKTYAIIESRENLQGEGTGEIIEILAQLIAENRDNIFEAIKNIREITENNRENFFKIVRNIKNITSKINSGQGTLGKLINENQVHENTDDLINEIRDSMEDLREQAPVTSFIRAALTVF